MQRSSMVDPSSYHFAMEMRCCIDLTVDFKYAKAATVKMGTSHSLY